MEKKKLKELFSILLFPILIVFIDRFTKVLLLNVNIEYTINKGLLLGLLGTNSLLVLVVHFIILCIILIVILKVRMEKIFYIILISIFAAGCSNFYDRIMFDGVIDFIKVGSLISINIADLTITIGGLSMLGMIRLVGK